MQLPAIDKTICGQWSQLDNDFYNRLPYYLVKRSILVRRKWNVFDSLLDSIKWTPNMGDTMRAVGTEPAPTLRQEAYPARLGNTPKMDVIMVRERRTDAYLRWHKFRSPNFNFLPTFQDFAKHITDTMENIETQMTLYNEFFFRTQLYAAAPKVYLAGTGVVDAPVDVGSDFSTNQKWAWLQANLDKVTNVLTMSELFKALNVAEDQLGIEPFEGQSAPSGDSKPFSSKWAFVCSGTDYNNLVADPWLLQNRPLNMNVVNNLWTGELFNKLMFKFERYQYRILATGSGSALTLSLPQPEISQIDSTALNGRTLPNPDYATRSQYAIGFLLGKSVATKIASGAPPAPFSGAAAFPNAPAMQWNGKPWISKNFLVDCADENGNIVKDTNSDGEFMRWQATLCTGIRLDNPFQILPVIYKRPTNTLPNAVNP